MTEYFTPDIGYFREGAEYELRGISEKRFNPCVYKLNDGKTNYIRDWLRNGDIRVKKLSQECIEAEGWILVDRGVSEYWHSNNPNFHLRVSFKEDFAYCRVINSANTNVPGFAIPSRADLRQIMKYLNIGK